MTRYLYNGLYNRSRIELRSFIVIILILAILYPILSAIVPGWDIVLTYGAVLAIAALGFNLLLGYAGLLSFGHAAFFGIGAYTAALLTKLANINSIEIYIALGSLTSSGLALLIGPIVARYTKIFFAILMLVIAQVLWSLYIKLYPITGGTDGIRVGRPSILGFDTSSLSYYDFQLIYHYYTLMILAVLTYIMWRIINSPFGYSLRALKDNETRARFVGLDIKKYRVKALVISAIYTGIAGALYASLNRVVTPELAYWTFSGKLIFITILGGSKFFTGPIIGSLIYTFLETIATGYTQYWQMLLGILIILIMIFMPGGLIELAQKIHITASKPMPGSKKYDSVNTGE